MPPQATVISRSHISSRERQVLELVSRGWSNRVIAAHLGVSPSTIKSHMESILMRFEARNRAEGGRDRVAPRPAERA